MKSEKLFSLLVMGGALLTVNSPRADEPVQPTPALCSPFDSTKPVEENSCVKNEEGKEVVNEGLVCCWGSSCGTE